MLIFHRRFLPFFLSQSLGAFNDNFYRNALVLLITFSFAESLGDKTGSVIALCPMLFMSPYFLVSALAGRMADRFDKALLVRWLKWSELGIMLLAVLGFALMQLWLLLVVLFLLGIQAALYGPVKYAILPPLLKEDELVSGNAWVEASTFIVILAGTIASSLLMLTESGRHWVSLGCVGFSAAGIAASQFIPRVPPANPAMKMRYNILADSWSVLRGALVKPELRRRMLPISWFWALGSVYLSQMPLYAKIVLGDETGVFVPWLLGAFTVGIAFGAMACSLLSRGRPSEKTVMPGALGMAAFAIDFYIMSGSNVSGVFPYRIAFDFFGIALSAGLYIVPLYTMLQRHAGEENRGQVIAASNILDALLMTGVALATAALIGASVSVVTILCALALFSPIVCWAARKI